MATTLTPTQRYAAGALERQAQIHQSAPLGSGSPDPGPDDEERASSASGSSSSTAATISSGSNTASGAGLWTHDSRGLLRPVFRFLEIEPVAWAGIEETAAPPDANHHIGAFLRILLEEDSESSSDMLEQEHALAKAVDVMVMSLGSDTAPDEKIKDETKDSTACTSATVVSPEAGSYENLLGIDKLSLRTITARWRPCVTDKPVSQEEEDRKSSHFRKGYDARHRVVLRLILRNLFKLTIMTGMLQRRYLGIVCMPSGPRTALHNSTDTIN